MKIKIFCILTILLFITTVVPIGSAYIQNKEILTDIKTQSSIDEPVNYLGKITVFHRIIGGRVFFEPTNDRDFYFPVEDGKVYLNFTVTGCHVLDPLAHYYREFIRHRTRWLCQVRSDYYTTYAEGSLFLYCEVVNEPECTDFEVIYTDVELELEKGETRQLWVGYGVAITIQIFGGNPIPLAFIYPRNEWYDFWNLLYPGICFFITVHGI